MNVLEQEIQYYQAIKNSLDDTPITNELERQVRSAKYALVNAMLDSLNRLKAVPEEDNSVTEVITRNGNKLEAQVILKTQKGKLVLCQDRVAATTPAGNIVGYVDVIELVGMVR